MGMLILEATGDRGEELAMQAGKVTETAVGWDSEFNSATFDSESLGDAELQGVIFDALSGIDAEWRTHLQVVE